MEKLRVSNFLNPLNDGSLLLGALEAGDKCGAASGKLARDEDREKCRGARMLVKSHPAVQEKTPYEPSGLAKFPLIIANFFVNL